jgi:hypothetical protein
MTEEIFYIYKVTGKCGRSYVGVTKRTPLLRWKQHIKESYAGSTTVFHNAIRKYGESWFSIKIITECFSRSEAEVCERAMIAAHDTYCRGGKGFNLTIGGDGNWGWAPSEETKRKIGEKSRERMAANPDYLRKMVASRSKNQKRPQNSKRAAEMGRAKKGISLSDEHRRKISLSSRGRVNSKESIEKAKVSRSWYRPTQETIEKMRASKKGKKLSPEQSIAAARRLAMFSNLSQTPESIKKARDSQKKWFANAENAEKHKIRVSRPEYIALVKQGIRRANEDLSPEAVARRAELSALRSAVAKKVNANPDNISKAIRNKRRWKMYNDALAARGAAVRDFRALGKAA